MIIELVFEALASTPRRKILAYLSEASLTAGEIADRFEMSKPSLTKHLKILEHAGLVKSDKKGQYVHYSIADDNMMATISNFLATFCPVGSALKQESVAVAKSKNNGIQ